MWIAQTIGIEALAGLSLAAGEVQVTFLLALVASSGLTRANRVHRPALVRSLIQPCERESDAAFSLPTGSRPL